MSKRVGLIFTDSVFLKLISVCLMLFFLLLSDGLLSFWVPNFLDKQIDNSILVGLVIAFSSFVGFGVDFFFPQLVKSVSVKRLMLAAIGLNIIFLLGLFLGEMYPFIGLFLLAMAIWGVYYEMIAFVKQMFVADSMPRRMHATAWGLLGMVSGIVYSLAPLIGGYALRLSEFGLLWLAFGFSIISFLMVLLIHVYHKNVVEVDFKQVNIRAEIDHWKILFTHVWTVVVISLLISMIDSVMWTIGAIYTEELFQVNVAGGWFLSLYLIPSMFMGIVISQLKIINGKKVLAERLLLILGIFLVFVGEAELLWIQLLMIFIVGMLAATIYPLVDAVYSDIVSRMGRQRQHMIGLSSSIASIAYVIGPIVSGVIAYFVGYQRTFVIFGVILILIGVEVMKFTPKKIHLPQSELKSWS